MLRTYFDEALFCPSEWFKDDFSRRVSSSMFALKYVIDCFSVFLILHKIMNDFYLEKLGLFVTLNDLSQRYFLSHLGELLFFVRFFDGLLLFSASSGLKGHEVPSCFAGAVIHVMISSFIPSSSHVKSPFWSFSPRISCRRLRSGWQES